MGTFAQRGLAASSLGHCGSPVPITRDAAIPRPLFTLGKILGVFYAVLHPKSSGIRRSPGYLPAVARLDAVLDPGVSALHSSLSRSPLGLLLFEADRHSPKIQYSRGYVSDSGLHPSPRHTRLFPFRLAPSVIYTTERLTNLTQEGLWV